MVEQIAQQATLAVWAHQLSGEVQRSRAELVRAREHERLRIRRDVHDGIGPTLAAVPLQLDAITARLDARDEDAQEIARRVKDEVRSAVADLRLLIDGMRPANLDHFGLVGAIEQRAASVRGTRGARQPRSRARPSGSGCRDGSGRAARGIESLANVVRHASAERVDVCVAVRGRVVLVDVADDGNGTARPLRAGVGLESMRERVTELEGSLQLSRGPLGGFRVCASIPLESP